MFAWIHRYLMYPKTRQVFIDPEVELLEIVSLHIISCAANKDMSLRLSQRKVLHTQSTIYTVTPF